MQRTKTRTRNPYRKTDKAIRLLNRKAVKRFQRLKAQAGTLNADELNILKATKELYRELDSDNRKAFLELARASYEDAILDLVEMGWWDAGDRVRQKEAGDRKGRPYRNLSDVCVGAGLAPARQTKEFQSEPPTKKWLNALLDGYDDVWLTIYSREVERKRDYAAESIVAAKNRPEQIQKALRYWSRYTQHTADRVTDRAVRKAYEDAGVVRVEWVTKRDEKVCRECGPLDGKQFDITKLPPKPHIGCRCTLRPIV